MIPPQPPRKGINIQELTENVRKVFEKNIADPDFYRRLATQRRHRIEQICKQARLDRLAAIRSKRRYLRSPI